MKNKLPIILFVLVTIVSLSLRFWDYPDFVNFHLDPPAHVTDVKDMIEDGKLRLTGPEITSKEVMGRHFFTGPFHYWVLALLGLSTNWNIVLMTAFYTLLWFAFFILLYFWLESVFKWKIALIVYSLLSFLPQFIPISKSMWNPHFLPLFGLGLLYFLVNRKINYLYYFIAGFLCGLGFNVHYSAVLWFILVFYFIYRDYKEKRFAVKDWLLFVAGFILAELPFILFELRHNFYNIRTILFHIKYGSLSTGYKFNLYYYYLFPFAPIAGYIIAMLLKVFAKRGWYFMHVFLVLLTGSLLIYDIINFKNAYVFPKGWTIARQKAAVNYILNDEANSFEVAETINSDTRALDIRWWLRAEDRSVMGVEDYDKASILYLVAPVDRPPGTEQVWEVRILRPFHIQFKQDLGEDLFLYKLVKK